MGAARALPSMNDCGKCKKDSLNLKSEGVETSSERPRLHCCVSYGCLIANGLICIKVGQIKVCRRPASKL